MNEIDYGALFDVGDMNETSENQTEAAEPSANAFAQGETCYLKVPGIMWYGREDEQAEAERNRRQLV